MIKVTRKSSGKLIGWLCILVGIFYLGYGIALSVRGRSIDSFDGILIGGLALVIGVVMLRRREKEARQQASPIEPGK